MYFDFEDRNFETPTIESAISWREQALVSLVGHVLLVSLVLFLPRLPFFEELAAEMELRRAAREAELAQMQEESQQAMLDMQPDAEAFVFVAPRVDLLADEPPRPNAVASDEDRIAQSPERTFDPDSRLPIAEGNSPRFVEADIPDEPQDMMAPLELLEEEATEDGGREDSDEPSEDQPDVDDPRLVDETVGHDESEELAGVVAEEPGLRTEGDTGVTEVADSALTTPGSGAGDPDRFDRPISIVADGLLGQATQSLDRSVRRETFHNLSGDTERFGSTLQFDTKGVDFGSWVRRFEAQVYRNWMVPFRIWTDHGHVVLTFTVHKNGRLEGVQVVRPSIDPFNLSAGNALRQSDPTVPLPEAYPDEELFITATFYFNESPSGRRR